MEIPCLTCVLTEPSLRLMQIGECLVTYLATFAGFGRYVRNKHDKSNDLI